MEAEIAAGRLGSGSRLPSVRELAAQFRVSQTVVREAIARLRANGIIVARHGSGLYVDGDARRRPLRIDPQTVTTVQSVIDIMEARLSLEVEAAGLAAERHTRSDARRILAALASFDRAVAAEEPAIDEDRAFHAAVAGATGNPIFSMLLEFLGRYIIPRQQVQVGRGTREEQLAYLGKIRAEHAKIGEAIAAGDPTRARAAMRRHLSNGLLRLRNLEPGGQEDSRRR
jgi:DNA-binding FadR family transcriptional regulator